MEFDPSCVRKLANWTSMAKYHKFDKASFNADKTLEDIPKYSPKVKALLDNIKEIDEKDMKEHGKQFKHFIFSEVKQGGFGVKIISAALIASGFKLAYDNKLKLYSDQTLTATKGDNFLVLCSTDIFSNVISAKKKKEILDKYNQRPDNVYGELARIILLDAGFKEGIDLFDIRYVHIFEPQTSKADLKQAIGRATRLCGQKGLDFHPSRGWPLRVFLYDVAIPDVLQAKYDGDTMFKLFMKSSGVDLKLLEFVDELEKYSIIGAIDYELTKNVHNFEIEDDEFYVPLYKLFQQGGQIFCRRKCGTTRPTKNVPVSIPLFMTVLAAQGKVFPTLEAGQRVREYFCGQLKKNKQFCADVTEAWSDPNAYVLKHKDVLEVALKTKVHQNLPPYNRQMFQRFISKIIKPKVKKENVAPLSTQISPQSTLASTQATPQSKQATPQSKQATPASTQATPQSKQATPASAQATPQSKQATPAQSTPQSAQSTPQSKQATPASAQATPASAQVTPQSKQATPQSKQATPQSKQATPASAQATPASAQVTPQSKQATPAQVTPQSKQATPAQATPQSKQATPAQATPQSKQATPASAQATPQSKQATPAQATPQSKQATPASAQATLQPTPAPKQATPQSKLSSSSDATPASQSQAVSNSTPQNSPPPPSPPKEELIQVMKELPKEEEKPITYPVPQKIMSFLEIRNFMRDNYIEFTWPKVTLENMCVPKGGADLVKFTPTQDMIRHYFTPQSAYKGVLLFSSVGTGKCHAKDTPILMYDGSIKMVQDITEGDYLMGDDSTSRKVLSLARGEDEMYDIVPVKGDKYTVNKEHILVLKYSGKGSIVNVSQKRPHLPYIATYFDNKEIRIKSKSFQSKEDARDYLDSLPKTDNIVEIEVQDYLKLSQSMQKQLKGYRTGVEFASKPVDFDPYIIGLWLGDGTSRESKITTQDTRIISYLYETLPKYNLMLNYESKYDYRISSISKNNNIFLQILKKHNMINNKHVPDIYKCNDRHVRLQVLAGLIDTDGSYSSKDKCFEISQKSEIISNDILFLARSLGFSAYVKKKEGSWTYKGIKKKGMYNRIIISGNGLENIPTRLIRKQAKERSQKKDNLVTGISVNHIGKGDYYGFTLDGNNRYLLGDFTVTHNTCSAIATATSSFEKENYTVIWVTRTTLKSDIWKNMFDQVCSLVIKERILSGQNIPVDFSKRMRMLSKSWKIKPMSYKQFSNLVSGKNQLYKDLVAINGAKDPLRKTLLIIDEAHKLYGGADLSSIERPNMAKLSAAISNSYKVSGPESVKVMLMTATPITNDPMELIKLVNLIREEQIPDTYKGFSEKYLNEFGKFTKKGMRMYLDDIAGSISYLNREKDARQFSQPTVIPIVSPLGKSQFGMDEIEKLQEELDTKTQENQNEIAYFKDQASDVKQRRMQFKKDAKAKCTGLKGPIRAECLTNAEQEISIKDKEYEANLEHYSGRINELTANNKDLKFQLQTKKKLAKEDVSQQAILESKCLKANKKKKAKKL